MARSDRFLARGLALLHLTPRRLRAPAAPWPRQLEDAVTARAGGSQPPGLEVRPRGPVPPADRPPGPTPTPRLGGGVGRTYLSVTELASVACEELPANRSIRPGSTTNVPALS